MFLESIGVIWNDLKRLTVKERGARMDFLIELVFEIIFEGVTDGVLEGALDGVSSKKVPLPFRILLAVVLLAVFAAVAALFIWIAVKIGNPIVWVLVMLILAALGFGLCWKIGKAFHKRNSR